MNKDHAQSGHSTPGPTTGPAFGQRVIPVEVFDLVLFGATGDLAQRKILPGLFHRFVIGQMPPGSHIIASGRSDMGTDRFRTATKGAIIAALERDAPDHRQLDDVFEMHHLSLRRCLGGHGLERS